MTGRCASCGNGFDDGSGAIYAMRQLWHKEHFACALCSRQICHRDELRMDAARPLCRDCFVSIRKPPKCA
uniref:LIM zinc-binding domain-containing protein n=1 Tax=Plectus sambesii TaxID=2011161 RepID=A0A914VNI0_9BILA